METYMRHIENGYKYTMLKARDITTMDVYNLYAYLVHVWQFGWIYLCSHCCRRCHFIFVYVQWTMKIKGEFVYAITAAEGIILSSLFIGRKQR